MEGRARSKELMHSIRSFMAVTGIDDSQLKGVSFPSGKIEPWAVHSRKDLLRVLHLNGWNASEPSLSWKESDGNESPES